ncbi:unnamed protein product [Trifolium pratense]|uniref:Uncharacterized protein n=1 Tax=Trifolium pratense TaxID=57577 RepID=A0ACB0IKL0_TRIPR|nr:unnamed protein product [Trifolium pratense]
MISWIYNLSSHYNQVITAPPSTDGPTPATNQPISPPSNEPENNDESQFAVNNPSNKPKKKSMTYWTIDVRVDAWRMKLDAFGAIMQEILNS